MPGEIEGEALRGDFFQLRQCIIGLSIAGKRASQSQPRAGHVWPQLKRLARERQILNVVAVFARGKRLAIDAACVDNVLRGFGRCREAGKYRRQNKNTKE